MEDVHLQCRATADELLRNPEIILQRMSFRIHARRQALIDDQLGKTVYLKDLDGNVRAYKLDSVDEAGVATVLSTNGKRKSVNVNKLSTSRSGL